MPLTNKINFQDVNSDLLAAGIMYFEDYIATLHKNLTESGFANFDAFSIIEITTTMLTTQKSVQITSSSLKSTMPNSTQRKAILDKVEEFHQILHDNEGKLTLQILRQKGAHHQKSIALVIMFLNHLAANFLRILKVEKSKLTASEMDKTKFTQLLAIIFDKAFEKTLSELK